MANKHFEEFFNQFRENYLFVLTRTQELVKELETCSDEDKPTIATMIDNFKKTTEPIINNYFIYKKVKELLDIPVRKKKQIKYQRQLKKVKEEEKYSPDALLEQEKTSINSINELLGDYE